MILLFFIKFQIAFAIRVKTAIKVKTRKAKLINLPEKHDEKLSFQEKVINIVSSKQK